MSMASSPFASAATLDDNHVQTIQDVVNLVPGFSATSQGDHGVITMTMRGIGNDSAYMPVNYFSGISVTIATS